MIAFLLLLFVLALLLPRLFGAALRVLALVLLLFGAWWFLHPDCESDACRQALFNYQNDVR